MEEDKYKETAMQSIATFGPLPPALERQLYAAMEVAYFEKGKLLLKTGSVCDRMHYILRGLVHCYSGSREKPDTDNLIRAGEWAKVKESYYTGERSRKYLEAMEDTVSVSLLREDLERWYLQYPVFNVNGRKMLELEQLKSDVRVMILKPSSPRERYAVLKREMPEILMRVPGKNLASFMGMREETLSRIRTKEKSARSPRP